MEVGLSLPGSVFGWPWQRVRKPPVISCSCGALLSLIMAGRRDKAPAREDVSIGSLRHFYIHTEIEITA